jgi:NAD(P)-dependent dehydrogenase (short-subunit alcohol dehydrogenase family)
VRCAAPPARQPSPRLAPQQHAPACSSLAFRDGPQIDDPATYDQFGAYGQSKLANVLFARLLAERLKGEPVLVAGCHPGAIDTELSRHMRIPGWLKVVGKLALRWGAAGAGAAAALSELPRRVHRPAAAPAAAAPCLASESQHI